MCEPTSSLQKKGLYLVIFSCSKSQLNVDHYLLSKRQKSKCEIFLLSKCNDISHIYTKYFYFITRKPFFCNELVGKLLVYSYFDYPV
jgi:hypothetical protein